MPSDGPTKISHRRSKSDPRSAETLGGLDQEIVAPWPVARYHGVRSPIPSQTFSIYLRLLLLSRSLTSFAGLAAGDTAQGLWWGPASSRASTRSRPGREPLA